jgi:hypothetical protein
VAPEKPEFDPKEIEEKFDDDNPEIDIPDEVPVEMDNDWDLDEAEEEAAITAYWTVKE